MRVIKRDGRKVPFDSTKPENAILQAFNSVDGEITPYAKNTTERIINTIKEKFANESKVTVEQIQDVIEEILMATKRKDVAKAFILFRDERNRERQRNSDLMVKIKEKLSAANVQNQNANVDEYSFGGRKGEADSEINRYLALNEHLSKKARENHLNNRIYTHDLDAYALGMHNCLSIPFDELLSKGFYVKQTDVRPANGLSTALQLVAVIFQLQSLQQFGGVSATHLDWTMVPYIRKSFAKHYKDGLLYINCKEDAEGRSLIDYEIENMLKDASSYSIEDPEYQIYSPEAYKYAVDLTKRECDQACEGMYHNLNTLQSRSGNQLPFTSINYGTCTLPEGRMFIRALLDASIKGVGKMHKTPIFPCGIFQKKKGVNDKGSPNYDLYRLALESTSKRLYPNYVSCDWTPQLSWTKADRDIKREVIRNLTEEEKNKLIEFGLSHPEDFKKLSLEIKHVKEYEITVSNAETPLEIFSTMGCRTVNGSDVNTSGEDFKKILDYILKKGEIPSGVMYSAVQKDGRGNICPITIIMPMLAMEAKEELDKEHEGSVPYKTSTLVDRFINKLAEAIEESKDQLIARFEWICSQSSQAASFMYENKTMAGYIEEEGIKSALKHGTIVIGQLGLAETLQILIGCDHTVPSGMELAKRIEQLFKDKCLEFKKQYSLNFGVYFTPAENLCYTAMNIFKERYGVIPNVSERAYFTNSIHVPVDTVISPFDKIDIESELTGYSSAGCITYVELDGGVRNNIDALEALVDYAMEKDIPYLGINVPNDTCLKCGFTGEFNDECPMCHSSDIQQLRRVTGYLTGDYRTAFNKGKQAEVKDRVIHGKGNINKCGGCD